MCDMADMSGSEKRIIYPTRSNFVSTNYNCINLAVIVKNYHSAVRDFQLGNSVMVLTL
jgi:hypothetical protein